MKVGELDLTLLDKLTEIERQNRLLLEKIARIMTTSGKHHQDSLTSQGSLHEQSAIKVSDPQLKLHNVMLNKRQRDLVKLNDENLVSHPY